jgi:hypothetical protein
MGINGSHLDITSPLLGHQAKPLSQGGERSNGAAGPLIRGGPADDAGRYH